jgi:class 3 adenylate cyclase/tetratricopeptide (TPR) repeat protein
LEGTLLFADISGFTLLSERLARRGRVGAEDLVTIINGCFAGLLEVAYAQGGSLLKFGGDALLLFFSGPENASRAANAAWQMRERLRAFGRNPPITGIPRLRMSIGIHSDRFQFFLVGGSHRELVVTGPGATQTVECEAVAEASEILISQKTAALLDSRVLGTPKGPGRLLAAAPAVVRPAGFDSAVDVGEQALEALIPSALREHLKAGAEEPEHRDCAIAFIRFSGTEALLAGSGIEAAAEAIDQLVQTTQAAAEKEGVTLLESDIDRDGGKLMLVAGAPTASDRDEEKLLRVLREIVDSPSRLMLQVGVNYGHVFTGVIGTPFRQHYSVMGDPVNLAARLAGRAAAGQVVATPRALERSRIVFQLESLEPFRVKGKKKPIEAFTVGPVLETRTGALRSPLPIVGRDGELAMIRKAVEDARHGHGTLVELVGEPGIGKSRLIEELQGMADGRRMVLVESHPYEAATPYFAIGSALRSLIGLNASDDSSVVLERLASTVSEIAPDLLPWLPLLAVPFDVRVPATPESDAVDPRFRRTRTHALVLAFLQRLLPDPCVIVFEDVHWMDEPSSDILRLAADQVAARPWLVCVTRRAEPHGFLVPEGIRAVSIQLTPLSSEASSALIVLASSGRLASPLDLRALAERAGGNPLFLRELAAADLPRTERGVLPDTVQAVIASKIDRLGPRERTALRYASVMGAVFDDELMRISLTGAEELAVERVPWGLLAEFIDVAEDGSCRFRHALFREVAYEGLSYARRRQIHLRVGEVYEGRYGGSANDHAEVLSLHFLRGGAAEKAWHYARLAGDRAREKYANEAAAEFYRRALEAARHLRTRDPDEVPRVWEALGDVCELSARYTEAQVAYRSSRTGYGDEPAVVPRLLRKEGVLRERQGRYTDALRWYTRGLHSLDAVRNREDRIAHQIQLSLARAGVHFRQGHFANAIEWSSRAQRDAEAAGDRVGLAHAYYLLHTAHYSLGSPDRIRYRELALPIYEELGDLVGMGTVLNNLGVDAYFEGRWDDALALYRRGQEARERAGDVVNAAASVNNIGEIRSDQGHLDEAERLFRTAHDIASATGYQVLRLLTISNLGRAAARSGRFVDSRRLLNEALEGFQKLGAASFILETKAREAELAIYAGDHALALEIVDHALVALPRLGGNASLEAMLLRQRGLALLQAERPSEAAAPLHASLKAARLVNGQFEVALTLLALAWLSRTVGKDFHATLVESQAFLEQLGVVRTPQIPLPVGELA